MAREYLRKVRDYIRRSIEYRYSAKEWRIGETKSKSGYRTIPLTEEAVAILKKQKEKNKRISEMDLVAEALMAM